MLVTSQRPDTCQIDSCRLAPGAHMHHPRMVSVKHLRPDPPLPPVNICTPLIPTVAYLNWNLKAGNIVKHNHNSLYPRDDAELNL